jgi:hypothetical protein
MQAGEPLPSDGPIVMATARMEIMRAVICHNLAEEKKPRPPLAGAK